jgi:hypothetical protein
MMHDAHDDDDNFDDDVGKVDEYRARYDGMGRRWYRIRV